MVLKSSAVQPRVVDGQFVVSVAWGDFPPEESLFRAKPILLDKATILVINGNAATGQAALRALGDYQDLYHVKATTRGGPSDELRAELPYVEWLTCDWSKEALTRVTKGVEKIFYVMPPAENRVELARNVSAAAVANGVQYIVDVSVAGANYRAILFANQCRDQEEIFEASGMAWTHLRCMGWYSNVQGVAQAIKTQNKFYMPLGTGAMCMLDHEDVGRAAVRLLTRMGAEGVVVDLTGPEPLTGEDIAAALSAETGRTIEYVSPPLDKWVAELEGHGMPVWFAEGLAELNGLVQKGMTGNVSPDGQKLLGKMTTFREWVHKHRSAFI